MLKLLGTITLLAGAFYAAQQAGWLTEAQAQYVPQLDQAIPPALEQKTAISNHISEPVQSVPSKLTDRVSGQK